MLELMKCGLVYARVGRHGLRRMSWTEFVPGNKGYDFVLFDRSGLRRDEDSDRMMRDVNMICFAGSAWSYSTRCSTLREVIGHGGKIWAFNGNDEIFRLNDRDCSSTDYTESEQATLRGAIARRFGQEPDGIVGTFHVNWVIEHCDGVCTEGLRWVDE